MIFGVGAYDEFAYEAISFDDVCLVPSHSEIESRTKVDVSVEFPKGFRFFNPIVPANMRSVASFPLLQAALKKGSLCLLHRFEPTEHIISKYLDLVATDIAGRDFVGVSVGVKEADYKNIVQYLSIGCRIFAVDIAHGDSNLAGDMCEYIRELSPDSLIIAGNVVTASGVQYLKSRGADVVKVGVGSGEICSSRIVAGVGLPQLSAVYECYKAGVPIISDGGIRYPGDVTKAIAAGAHLVMNGSLFARTVEAFNDGVYEGSSRHAGSYVEGIAKSVVPVFNVNEVYDNLLKGLRSGMSYLGCATTDEMREESHRVVKISSRESQRDRDK